MKERRGAGVSVNEFQRGVIRDAVRENFGPGARVYLLGSGRDARKDGGDIDLFIETDLKDAELVRAKLETLSSIQRTLGDRTVDIVTADPNEQPDGQPEDGIVHKTGTAL
jgi:hypothetical protein